MTDVKSLGILILFVCLIGLLLGHSYHGVAKLLSSPGWLAALAVHGFLSCGILVAVWRRGDLRDFLRLPVKPARFPASLYWSAPFMVLGVCFLAAFASRLILDGATTRPVAPVQWLWVFVVPVFEEIVFRLGIGTGFRRRGGAVSGAWFSAILFAWMHTQPTLSQLASGQWGLPLGPFLLGLACEAMLVGGRSLYPLILLHAACNGTVVVFSVVDARWLSWLGYLYG